jgi:hypothetical protein
MTKLRTVLSFHNFVDADFAWRFKEIADLKSAIISTPDLSRKAMVRAFVPILYAHWEGFVKAASEALLNFISYSGQTYRELKPHFIAYAARRKLDEGTTSGDLGKRLALVEFFLNQLDDHVWLNIPGAIKTQANLSSVIFERIAESLCIDTSRYQTKYILIDKSLLERRNNIAHGEYLDVESGDVIKLSEAVIDLMRNYKTDIQNIVATKFYLAEPQTPPAQSAQALPII